ncbi:MAG: PAS domain-containing protein, partial [Pseudomonadota bacterium]
EEQKEEALAFVRKVAAGKKVESIETKRLTRDGRTLDVRLTVTALLNEAGRVTEFATTERDITACTRMDKAFQESGAG